MYCEKILAYTRSTSAAHSHETFFSLTLEEEATITVGYVRSGEAANITFTSEVITAGASWLALRIPRLKLSCPNCPTQFVFNARRNSTPLRIQTGNFPAKQPHSSYLQRHRPTNWFAANPPRGRAICTGQEKYAYAATRTWTSFKLSLTLDLPGFIISAAFSRSIANNAPVILCVPPSFTWESLVPVGGSRLARNPRVFHAMGHDEGRSGTSCIIGEVDEQDATSRG